MGEAHVFGGGDGADTAIIPAACLLASLPASLGTAVWVLGLCDFRRALNLSEPQFSLLGG